MFRESIKNATFETLSLMTSNLFYDKENKKSFSDMPIVSFYRSIWSIY